MELSVAAGVCKNLTEKDCPVLKGFVVADQNHELDFKHPCSSLDNSNGANRSAYAFFENLDQKALALGEVELGMLAKRELIKGFNLSLQQLRVENFTEWANDPFSLSLEIKNKRTKQVITGPPSQTYFYSHKDSDYPEDKKYTISKTGKIDWVRLIEPEEEEKEREQSRQTEAGTCVGCDTESKLSSKEGEYKGSEFISIDKKQITNLNDPHTLYLVLRNEKTGQKIKLKGPDIKNMESLFNFKFSGPRVLTWGMFNPFQEGSLFDTIADAFKYGDCINLRKKAKKDFNSRFSKW